MKRIIDLLESIDNQLALLIEMQRTESAGNIEEAWLKDQEGYSLSPMAVD